MDGPLGIDDDLLSSCVQCGLCLPACPTYRSTGEESRSPRGRIDAMRDVQWRGAPIDSGFVEVIDSCVGCRSCEPACPSGVHYGELLEATRARLASSDGPGHVPWWRRRALALLDRRPLVALAARSVAVLQRLGLHRWGQGGRGRGGRGPLRNLPLLPLAQRRLVSTGVDVVLLTGCVMDATQREVHRSAVSVLSAAGFGVTVQPRPGCCGALAAHAGLRDVATAQLEGLAASLPADVPVLSDSAGCAAAIATAASHPDAADDVTALARRTEDISTFLLRHSERLALPGTPTAARVTVQHPCHLRNVLGAHEAVSQLLSLVADVVEPDDGALCCGAGGAHSVMRAEEAAAMRDRKVAALEGCGGAVVASANPGCSLHLAAGGVVTAHPVEILERLLRDAGGMRTEGDHDGR